jgi:lysophospholipid acyltransferase (LPLAT)-like uncharacterized protein
VKRALARLVGWLIAFILLAFRATCRYRVIDDRRPALRAAGRPYAYALLHAHQAAAVFVNDEAHMAAMVSRSADGDLLVPSLRVRRVTAARGSSRSSRGDKGGRAALAELTEMARECVPVLLAVDGPHGPRGHVHRGVVELAVQAGAVVLPVLVLPSRRWILRGTWDRFQIPKPFAEVRLVIGDPLEPGDGSDEVTTQVLQRVARSLDELERRHDPEEWERARQATAQRRARRGQDAAHSV